MGASLSFTNRRLLKTIVTVRSIDFGRRNGRGIILSMKGITVKDTLHLPVDKRIELVCDIWDSISAVPEAVDLTDEEAAFLDQRMKAFHENPEAGSPWEEVYARLQARLRR
jgi:putative addiction module component (TIGR02574 family)